MISVSVIIPTYERPDDLRRCLETMVSQTSPPDELIVVDDGDLDDIPLRAELTRAGVTCRYVKKDRPGLTESRNAGIQIASGEIIVFFDDDVTLAPDFFERLIAVFANDSDHEIGGTTGVIVNVKPANLARRLRYLFDRFFLLTGPIEGTVLRSGAFVSFGTTPYPLREKREVDFLPGCAQAYRREVFDALRFTEGYRDYAFGEDKDFSHQVSKRWKLMATPEAECEHHEAKPMRPNHRVSGRKRVVGRYLFFHRHVRDGRWSIVLFWYSLSGYFLARIAIALVAFRRSEYERLRGMFAALSDIARDRVPHAREAGGVEPVESDHESVPGPT